MSNTIKKSLVVSLVLCLALLMLFVPFTKASALDIADGKYETTFNDKIGMGIKAFENSENKVIVEKIGNNYYLTVSVISEKISDFTLHLQNKKVGEVVKYDGGTERHTYTLSESDIFSTLNFSGYIKKMGNVQEFTITPEASGLKKIGEADNLVERPACFVPVITTSAVSSEKEVNSNYIIAPATAKMGEQNLDVSVSAYYVNNGVKTDVAINNRQISLNLLGEYHVVYRAESSSYKTNFNNNSFSEIDIKIISKNNAKKLVDVGNISGSNSLPSGVNVVSGYVDSSREIAKIASEKMREISVDYKLISVALFDSENNPITLNDKVKMSFDVADTFDKSKVVIYHIASDGTLTRLGGTVDGEKVVVETDKTGNFIACIEGVPFVMPMWAYAVIVGVVVVTIIVIIVVVKRKKKKKLAK